MDGKLNMSHEDMAKRVDAMTDAEQQHFKQIIMRVVLCFGEGAMQGVFITSKPSSETLGLFTINCEEMEAATLLMGANDYIGFLNMQDAPPKEKFN